ncbi:MAG: hypothetical protein ACRDH7_10205 [Actinomycetota bacterium]
MGTDPLIDRIDELERNSRELEIQLRRLRRATAEIRRARAAGHPVAEILRAGPGVPARRSVREAWLGVNQALHAYRVTVVELLVDVEGLSIADSARLMGNARQVISRLYHGSADR